MSIGSKKNPNGSAYTKFLPLSIIHSIGLTIRFGVYSFYSCLRLTNREKGGK